MNVARFFGGYLLVFALTVVALSGTAHAKPPKGDAKPAPAASVAAPAKTVRPPAPAPIGPWTDGLYHVVYGSKVDKFGCMAVDQLQIVDRKWLYVCRSANDNLFHVVYGDGVGDGFVKIRNLEYKDGVVSYIGVEQSRDQWSVKGGDKTKLVEKYYPREEGVVVWRGPHASDLLPIPELPAWESHGQVFRDYIWAAGMPLVKFCEVNAHQNCRILWGKYESRVWQRIAWVRWHDQVEYLAQSEDDLWHVVIGKTASKGCDDIRDVVLFSGQVAYRCKLQGVWYVYQGANASQPFDEMGELSVAEDGKVFYAARRNPAQSSGSLLQ